MPPGVLAGNICGPSNELFNEYARVGMSLLDDDYPLLVPPNLAVAIGLKEAMILRQIHYWLKKSKDGWVYNSYPAWQKQFPFWSIDTIKRTIRSLEKSGYIISKQEASTYRRKHYTINYQAVDEIQ